MIIVDTKWCSGKCLLCVLLCPCFNALFVCFFPTFYQCCFCFLLLFFFCDQIKLSVKRTLFRYKQSQDMILNILQSIIGYAFELNDLNDDDDGLKLVMT